MYFFLMKEALTAVIEVVWSASADGESEDFCGGTGFAGILKKLHL